MRYFLISVFCALVAASIFGCGGSRSLQSGGVGDMPDWYNNKPQDANNFYATATATSQDLQLSVDKATAGARAELGRMVETKIQGLQKRFDEETGIAKDAQLLQMFTQATKLVVNTTLSGSQISKQQQYQDGDIWRAYVLMAYPVGAANVALMQQIKKNEQLYTRIRASQAFKELDDEVKKFEEAKKE